MTADALQLAIQQWGGLGVLSLIAVLLLDIRLRLRRLIADVGDHEERIRDLERPARREREAVA